MSSPSVPKIPAQNNVESLNTVNDLASESALKEKRRLLLQGGRAGNLIAGIQNALKKRLGE